MKQWPARGKKVYPLAGELTTQMRYAVLGDEYRFKKHKHAYKAWRMLKELGCTVYPVAQGLSKIDGYKVYPDLLSLTDKIDVVVPCLKADQLESLVEECKQAKVKAVWFQEGNWTQELQQQCEQAELIIAKGCVLKHKTYSKPLCFFNPCYWHGLQSPKAPSKRY